MVYVNVRSDSDNSPWTRRIIESTLIPTNPLVSLILLNSLSITVHVIIHGSSKPEGIHHIKRYRLCYAPFSMSIYRRYAKASDGKSCVYLHLSKPAGLPGGGDAHHSTVVLLLVVAGYSEPVDTGASTQNACIVPDPQGLETSSGRHLEVQELHRGRPSGPDVLGRWSLVWHLCRDTPHRKICSC